MLPATPVTFATIVIAFDVFSMKLSPRGFGAETKTSRDRNDYVERGSIMTIRNLDKLFSPKSVAMIGASNRPRALGDLVMRNLLKGGFTGPIIPVNPKSEAVAGVLAYPNIENLPVVPTSGSSRFHRRRFPR